MISNKLCALSLMRICATGTTRPFRRKANSCLTENPIFSESRLLKISAHGDFLIIFPPHWGTVFGFPFRTPNFANLRPGCPPDFHNSEPKNSIYPAFTTPRVCRVCLDLQNWLCAVRAHGLVATQWRQCGEYFCSTQPRQHSA